MDRPVNRVTRTVPPYNARVPTLPGKPGILSFSFPGLEFAQKVVKTWNFKLKTWKKNLEICKFYASSFTFQDVIYKNNFFVICTFSTLVRSQTDLEFHCFYLEITWKIHGILCHKKSGSPECKFQAYQQQLMKKVGLL